MPAFLRRLVGHIALAVFLGSTALPIVAQSHLGWNDDVDCVSPELGPRHASAAFQSPASAASSAHCTICHWLRAFAGATLVPATNVVATADVRDVLRLPSVDWHGQTLLLDSPSRAPPSIVSL